LIAILALHRRDYGPAHKIPDSPSEGGARVDLAALGRLHEALPFDQGSRLIEPAILVVQAGHRSAGERIESFATFRAAIARQTSRLTPGPDIKRAAARTSRPRITLLCDVPENIALARCGERRRNRTAALLGPLRVRRRRPRIADLDALLTGIVRFREREFAKHDTALRRTQRRQRAQPSREIRRLHPSPPKHHSLYPVSTHITIRAN
jgi:hypothetical protein